MNLHEIGEIILFVITGVLGWLTAHGFLKHKETKKELEDIKTKADIKNEEQIKTLFNITAELKESVNELSKDIKEIFKNKV